MAAYSAAAGIVGNAQRRPRLVTSSVYSLYAFFAVMMLASALMIYAFLTHDYTIKYVAHYSDTSMPLSYRITAYWGGLDGSLMFWVAVLSAFAAIAVKANARRHRDMIGYVVGVIMLVQLFFLALLVYNKNPFATWLTEPPVDGKGLNPLLQNYWMVIHPPSLYIGFVAATIPFAFGIAALASGRLDDRWLASVRVWTFVCWFFLSLGLILGGIWAYEELGWGGYWAWDPVENAGLLPWFTATAFLHSVIIQEQRGMMKVWNLLLVILTFFLTIFGTFMTRSGVVQSVHAFGEDNELALLFIIFMVVSMVLSFGLMFFRMPQLRSAARFDSFISREFAFLLNNWILLGCAFFVLFVTMAPTLSEALTGERITIGPHGFNLWMVPLGLALLVLAGAAPLLAWRRTTIERLWSQFAFPLILAGVTIVALIAFDFIFFGAPDEWVICTRTSIFIDELKLPVALINFGFIGFTMGCIGQEFWRGMRVRQKQTGGAALDSLIGIIASKRRKYGGYVVHLGMAVMFLGFAGKAYETMDDFTVQRPGETYTVRDYTLRFDGLSKGEDDHKRDWTASLTLYHGENHSAEDDEYLGELHPARWQYKKLPDQPTTERDIYRHLLHGGTDIYVVLTGFEFENVQRGNETVTVLKQANFRVYVNPLVNFVWLGFAILALGTVICLLPVGLLGGNGPPKRRTPKGKAAEVAVIVWFWGPSPLAWLRRLRLRSTPRHRATKLVAPAPLTWLARMTRHFSLPIASAFR